MTFNLWKRDKKEDSDLDDETETRGPEVIINEEPEILKGAQEPIVSREMAEEKEEDEKTPKEKIAPTIYGVRFPWEGIIFVAIGLVSVLVDASFTGDTFETLMPNANAIVSLLIPIVVCLGCFLSIAFVGFMEGNKRYYDKKVRNWTYGAWITAGILLFVAKILAGLVGGGLDEMLIGETSPTEVFMSEEFLSNLVIAFVQLALYIGTGFLTRDGVKILTENNMREYFTARRKYERKIKELSERRGEIVEDIAKLKAYSKYAERLVKSKKSVKENVAQYNESARALIEAKMAVTVEPDLMEKMYDNAMEKEGRVTKK